MFGITNREIRQEKNGFNLENKVKLSICKQDEIVLKRPQDSNGISDVITSNREECEPSSENRKFY